MWLTRSRGLAVLNNDQDVGVETGGDAVYGLTKEKLAM
jgi:hypothetical protein